MEIGRTVNAEHEDSNSSPGASFNALKASKLRVVDFVLWIRKLSEARVSACRDVLESMLTREALFEKACVRVHRTKSTTLI